MRRDVYQAIADPTRRAIIDLLSETMLSVNEVADQFDISRPAISKQFKILAESGLVVIEKQGRERYCRIQPKNLVPAFMWLDQHRALWEEKIDAFENYVNDLNTKRKTNG